MPINPKINSDTTRSEVTSEKKTWTAPKPSMAGDHVKLDQDDIYPERVERIGQYLSDTTANNSSNTDVQTGLFPDASKRNSNPYPIAPPGEITKGFTEDSVEEAVSIFNSWKSEISFDPEIGKDASTGWSYGDPNTLLANRGQQIVQEQITASAETKGHRWANIARPKFMYERAFETTLVEKYADDMTPGEKGSKFVDYTHKVGLSNMNSDDPTFWDQYFDRVQAIAAKNTLAASGHSSAAAARSNDRIGSVAGSGLSHGGDVLFDDLQGDYKKVSLDPMKAGTAAKDTTADDQWADIADEMELKEIKSTNLKSFGTMNSWADPFESTHDSLKNPTQIALQLLEIWMMVQLRILATVTIYHVIGWGIGELAGALSGKDNRWEANYYPAEPQTRPGSAYDSGSSGWNHAYTNWLKKGQMKINEVLSKGDTFALLAGQLVGPALNEGIIIFERDQLNRFRLVLNETNIYIPRHILSTTANTSGYLDSGFLNSIAQGLDVATAYVRAAAAGMAQMFVNLTLADHGQNNGFYKVLFRTVIRSKAQAATFTNSDKSGWNSVLKKFGKEDKIMKFVNHLAMIGDLGTAAGWAGNIAFPENKVPLDRMNDFPTLRTAKSRLKGSFQGTLSLTETPSLMLLPRSLGRLAFRSKGAGIAGGDAAFDDFSAKNSTWSDKELMATLDPDDEFKKMKNRKYVRPATGNRFTKEQVIAIENRLEAEHVPFYIQDLRTNEIISFHAFLTSLSDSYTAEWNEQKGFGRMEGAQIYGGGSRSIGLSFQMWSMNQEDFHEMYSKINKLTTLVYPQWSQGTLVQSGEERFVQPFSQVPTASPLCRIRVGDLFTSNYSELAMARMMGLGDERFKYGEVNSDTDDLDIIDTMNDHKEENRKIKKDALKKMMKVKGFDHKKKRKILDKYREDPDQFSTWYEDEKIRIANPLDPLSPWIYGRQMKKKTYYQITSPMSKPPSLIPPIFGSAEQEKGGIINLFSKAEKDGNPIFKAFASTMGRGIAVAITQIDFDWGLGSVPWNLEPGERAPRACTVSLSLVPIHDITPGIDHEGFNRAPIYGIGPMGKIKGDPHLDNTSYEALLDKITDGHNQALNGTGYEIADKD